MRFTHASNESQRVCPGESSLRGLLRHRISGTAGRLLVSWMSDESGYICRELNLLILLAISERHKTIPNELDGMDVWVL